MRLEAGGYLAKVFGQASDDFIAMGFVLNAVDARRSFRVSRVVQFFRGKACDGVHISRGAGVFMGEGNFEAIGKTRKINLEMRMLAGQMFEGLQARVDDRRLQSSDGVGLQTGGLRQKTGDATRRRCQAGIGVNAHAQVFQFSGHGL